MANVRSREGPTASSATYSGRSTQGAVSRHPWDGDKQAIRDTFTTKAFLPHGTNQAPQFNPKSEKIKASRAIKRGQSLASEMVELSVHLHEIGWLERLVTRQVRLRRSETDPG